MIDKKFQSDIWVGYIAHGGSALGGVLFMFVVTRYGSVEIYGALMLLLSLSRIMGHLFAFRTNEALVAFYKQGEIAGAPERSKFAIFAGIGLDLISGTVLLAVAILGSNVLAGTLLKDPDAAGEVALFGYVMLISALKSSPIAFLQATERVKLANTIMLFEVLMRLAIAGYTALSCYSIGLREAIWAILGSASLATLFAYIFLFEAIFGRLRTTRRPCDRRLIHEYLRFNLQTTLSSKLKAGNQNIDSLVLGLLTNTYTAGVYATFRQMLAPLAFLSAPFAMVAYPRFVKAAAQRRQNEMSKLIKSVNRKLLLAFSAAALVILVGADFYVRVNSLEISRSEYVALFLMTSSTLVTGLLWWARPFSNSVNPNLSLLANFLATLFLLTTLFPATWVLGMVGTASAMFVLSVLLALYWHYALVRHT